MSRSGWIFVAKYMFFLWEFSYFFFLKMIFLIQELDKYKFIVSFSFCYRLLILSILLLLKLTLIYSMRKQYNLIFPLTLNSFLFFFFCCPGAWTQGFHLEQIHQPFFVMGFFGDKGLMNYLLGLVLNYVFPDLCLLSS
jgi:hypothetical protein